MRAASIWTTPEGLKATSNNLYYGLKHLGLIETAKWAKHFLKDFHRIVGAIFDEIAEKRKSQKLNGGGGENVGAAGAETAATASEGAAVSDAASAVEAKASTPAADDDWLAFPDFIGADAAIRG